MQHEQQHPQKRAREEGGSETPEQQPAVEVCSTQLQSMRHPKLFEARLNFRHPTAFPFFTERYFSQYRAMNVMGHEGNNIRLLLHSNGLCILCIDPSSELIRRTQAGELRVAQVRFGIKRNGQVHDRVADAAKVVGKKKKNAAWCQQETVLCVVETEVKSEGEKVAGPDFNIRACMTGSLIEVNASLADNPALIVDLPLSSGHVAIINPKTSFSFEQNFELVSKRVEQDKGISGE